MQFIMILLLLIIYFDHISHLPYVLFSLIMFNYLFTSLLLIIVVMILLLYQYRLLLLTRDHINYQP